MINLHILLIDELKIKLLININYLILIKKYLKIFFFF